jgi:putative membrane protein
MKRIVYFVIFLVLAVFGIVFAVLNAEPVPFNYYFGKLEVQLSLMLVLAIALGAVLGLFAGAAMLVRSRREVAKLRAIPIRDKH